MSSRPNEPGPNVGWLAQDSGSQGGGMGGGPNINLISDAKLQR